MTAQKRLPITRWRRTALAVSALIIALLPSVSAQNICDAVPLPQEGPQYGKDQGWNDVKYYSTIQLADVDGDGQDELIARAGAGIIVSHFNKQTGRWEERQTSLLADGDNGASDPRGYSTIRFGDVDGVKGEEVVAILNDGLHTWKYDGGTGWREFGPVLTSLGGTETNVNYYYETLRLADIDGDGQVELLVRLRPGLIVFNWNKSTSSWNQLTTSGPMPDAGSWYEPRYYETISFADIDGKGGAELMVRGSASLITYRWNMTSRTWSSIATGPGFCDGDSCGWDKRQYYKTIQFADIDGIPGAELIARAADGVETWGWVEASSRWVRAGGPLSALADSGGWESPQYYETIKLANIDGQPGAELLARGQAGIYAFRWNSNNLSWQPLVVPNGAVMSNVIGWSDPSSYETIHYGDIDNDGRAELIGRSPREIETYRLSADGTKLIPARIYGFPAFTGGQLTAYQAISNTLLNRLSGGDIRTQYRNKDLASSFPADYPALVRTMQKPTSVSDDDWNAVKTQLLKEFSYVAAVNTWFANNAQLLTDLGVSNFISAVTVANRLEMDLSRADTFNISFKQLADGITAGLSKLAEGAGQEEIAGAINLVSKALDASGVLDRSDGQADLALKVTEVNQRLNDHFTNAVTANGCNQSYYMSDLSLLEELGRPIVQGDLQWDDTLTGQLLTEGRRQYEIYLYKTLSQAAWEVINYGEGAQGYCGFFNTCAPPADYPAAYVYGSGEDATWIALQHHTKQAPLTSNLDYVFKQAPAGLGIRLEDVIGSSAGWNLPGHLYDGDPSAPVPNGACTTACFRSPLFYERQLGRLPGGLVVVAGVNFNQPISTSQINALALALRGGDSTLAFFNRQYVAAQLSLLAAPGGDQAVLRSKVSCYTASRWGVRLRNGVTLGPDSTLAEVFAQAQRVARLSESVDQRLVGSMLSRINGLNPNGQCHTIVAPPAP